MQKNFFQKWSFQAFKYSRRVHLVKSKDGICSGSGWSSSNDVESSGWLAQGAVMKLDTPTPPRIASPSPHTKKASGLSEVTSDPRGHSNLSI